MFSVASDENKLRIQMSLTPSPLKNAVISGLNLLEGVVVSTGPAPKGYLEEELSDWMGVLRVNDD